MLSERLDWLRAQIDQDELWALAASAPHFGDGPTVPGHHALIHDNVTSRE
jgi:hypothetical protein